MPSGVFKNPKKRNKKISKRNKGKHFSPTTEFKKGHPFLGGFIGRHHTEDSKRKIRKAKKGKPNPHKGYPLSEEGKRRLGELYKGEKCRFWKGGISFESYSIDWTQTLKRSIRERDHYICQLCGALQSDRIFDVHHIDYNKKNCDPTNLTTLCHSCNAKVNFDREYWEDYFKNKIN